MIQCQRRIRSFPSTVLYSARGGSGSSRPLYYTVPEEDPELPVHCIIQCQRRIRIFPSTVLYSARGGSGASRPLYYTVPGASRPLYYTVTEEDPELPLHCIIQCQRRIRSFPSTVLYSARAFSSRSATWLTLSIQCQRSIRSFPSTVLYSARGQCQRGSGASRPQYF